MNREFKASVIIMFGALNACTPQSPDTRPAPSTLNCDVSLFVLGNGQDAGKPQIGKHDDSAWDNPQHAALASSLGLHIEPSGARYLFDASPDIKTQLYMLDTLTGASGYRLDGIFLTHAHMGHYLGLAHLGREAMGAKATPVYAMPKMTEFLRSNGPWDLLIKLENVALQPLSDGSAVKLPGGVTVTPFTVPHREEYSETVGYKIEADQKSAIYLPDIDSWEAWQETGQDINGYVRGNDILFLDATFYSGDELPGRDMSKIPHPTIAHSMFTMAAQTPEDKSKVNFIHMNHSNPGLNPESGESKLVTKSGFRIARQGDQHCLD